MIELSVHLITYNNQHFLEETLDSILKQQPSFNYEVVISDDASTDATWSIITKYANKYPDTIKAKKNAQRLGILGNFKSTLDRCNGDYVFAIAGDDIVKSDTAFEKMVLVLKANSDLGFIDSGIDQYNQETGKTKEFTNKEVLKGTKAGYIKQLQLGLLTPIGICFNKAHLYSYVDFDTYLKMDLTIDDYPVLVDLAMNTDFETIKESLHIYRVHEDSYSHTKSFENHYFLKEQMRKLFDYFSKKYNFPEAIISEYYKNHYKELLFLAGYFENKTLGNDSYGKLKFKSFKDHINFYASQYPFIRKLIGKV